MVCEKKIVGVDALCGTGKDATDYSFSYVVDGNSIIYTHCGLSEGSFSETREINIYHWDEIIEWVKANERKGLFNDVRWYYADEA